MANGLSDPPCGLLTADAARSLVDSVDAFLFDCDGLRFVIPFSPIFLGIFPLRFCSLLRSDRWFLLPPLNLCLLGVIWKGDKLIEGVRETMELLRKMVRGI
jgi:phosphoglycolate phosphatase